MLMIVGAVILLKIMLKFSGDADVENRLVDKVEEEQGGMLWESSTETCALPYVKQIASQSFLYDTGSSNPVLHDNLEGVGWGGRCEGGSRGRARVYLWLIHVDVWQKPNTVV